jgi:hypothetical protein
MQRIEKKIPKFLYPLKKEINDINIPIIQNAKLQYKSIFRNIFNTIVRDTFQEP